MNFQIDITVQIERDQSIKSVLANCGPRIYTSDVNRRNVKNDRSLVVAVTGNAVVTRDIRSTFGNVV